MRTTWKPLSNKTPIETIIVRQVRDIGRTLKRMENSTK